MTALDALLRVLRPGGPPWAAPVFDAELAALGFVPRDAPAEVGVLRSLAAAGPLGFDVLVACLRSPALDRKRIRRAVDVLQAGGHVQRLEPDGVVALAARWQGRFAQFATLDEGPVAPVTLAGLDFPAVLVYLSAHARPVEGPALVARLARLLAWNEAGPEAADLARSVSALPPAIGALLGWLAPRLGHPETMALVHCGLTRVQRAAEAALGVAPSGPHALDASLFTCLSDFADVLTPEVLDAQAERREELLRRWCWFLGVAVPRETFPASVSRLVALDVRRALADLEAAAIGREALAVQTRLLDEERARRKAAAEAYTSGRRE
ncbi:hypothetical protein L6V77_12660 [Myxococcota bacterium]|nr:hypothetical protein [Myxococcota bacterium]